MPFPLEAFSLFFFIQICFPSLSLGLFSNILLASFLLYLRDLVGLNGEQNIWVNWLITDLRVFYSSKGRKKANGNKGKK